MKLKKVVICLTGLLAFTSCQKVLTSTNEFPSELPTYGLIKEVSDKPKDFNYQKWDDGKFVTYIEKVGHFSSTLLDAYLKSEETPINSAISPISLFMALALASEVSASNTRLEILNALDMTYEEVKTYTKDLISLLYSKKQSVDDKIASMLDVTNSIFLNEDLKYKSESIASLTDNYYCYPYQVDFVNDNATANKTIKDFVEAKTNKLINWNKEFSALTKFVMINTLYLKDLWNDSSAQLRIIDKEFKDNNNITGVKPFLMGNYFNGKIQKEENFAHFYTRTSRGYKMYFMLPDENVSMSDVYTKENIEKVLNNKYFYQDDKNLKRYHTSCVFPKFEASFSGDLKPLLHDTFNINDLFNNACDLTSLLKNNHEGYVSEVHHQTKLVVDELGIEGAAVTSMGVEGSAGPDEYEDVYEQLVMDHSFSYILTSPNNVILFSGVINSIK